MVKPADTEDATIDPLILCDVHEAPVDSELHLSPIEVDIRGPNPALAGLILQMAGPGEATRIAFFYGRSN